MGRARRATHLTNDAVQRTTAAYGAFEEANKLSMAELQAALAGQVRPAVAVRTGVRHLAGMDHWLGVSVGLALI